MGVNVYPSFSEYAGIICPMYLGTIGLQKKTALRLHIIIGVVELPDQ